MIGFILYNQDGQLRVPVYLWHRTEAGLKVKRSYSREIISRLSRSVFLKRTKTFYPRYLYQSIGTVDVSMWTSALLDWRLVLWVM